MDCLRIIQSSENSDNEDYSTVENKKRKKKTQLEKAGHKQKLQSQPSTTKNNTTQPQEQTTTKNANQQKPTVNNTTQNYSPKMQTIINQEYRVKFYFTTVEEDISRIKISDIWQQKHPTSKDIIIKTSRGFLLKSNLNKTLVEQTLTDLISNKILKHYQETKPNNQAPNPIINMSYSCVIASVEKEIEDDILSEYLNTIKVPHRFCKRIRSKATGQLTTLIRIITGDLKAFETLLNEGLFFKNRHYPIYPSKAPEPSPIPCAKCSLYTHSTDKCPSPITCRKCQGKHHTDACTSPLPPKCAACNSDEHQAWSSKCPKKPKGPIEGIPNARIKSINKKTHELDPKITSNNRIHTSMTYHDHIVETYNTKINKDNTDRHELLLKLKKRFLYLYNIDTTVVFSGNRMYILMFDLNESQNKESPTEPTEGTQISQNVTN